MFKRKIVASLFIVFSVFPLLFVSVVSAKVVTMEKGVVEVGQNEVVNDDLFVGAETVDIAGTVNGDVYAGAETVRVSGTINGDLHVGAGMFYLSGKISGDVYAGAGNITLSKVAIGDSIIVGSGNVSIDESSTIGGSLIVGAGTLNVQAPIKRNVMVGAGTVDLNSVVGGEARIAAGSISVGPDTKIGKDLYYTIGEEGNEIRISDSASVSGKIQKVERNFAREKEIKAAGAGVKSAFKGFSLFLTLMSLAGALLIGYLWLKFFPKSFGDSAGFVTTSFFKSLGVGFLVLIFTLPALILIALTMVGVPLAGLLFLLFILYCYLSKIVVGLSLGNWLAGRFDWKKWPVGKIFAVGLVAVYVLKIIPFVDLIFSFIILCTGLGALVLNLHSHLSPKK